jgi:hypothetical protein
MLPLLPQGPTIPGVDIANVIYDILPALGATSLGDLDWCTETELFQWADEAAKRLARTAGVWVEIDSSTAVMPSTSNYSAPVDHIDTIHVHLGTTVLRETSVRELLALDGSWQTSPGAVTRYSMDAGDPGTITIYQIPTAAGTLTVIYHQYPAQIEAGASLIAVASPIQDYFGYSMLAEARRKESDASMPEMADHFDQRVALYEQVIEHLWGADQ